MIVWDDTEPMFGDCVHKKRKCSFCYTRVRFPFVVWDRSSREEIDGWYEGITTFICSECCVEMNHGLAADMRGIKTARDAERMGFGRAARRAAVSGGLLYTTGAGNKQ